MSAGTRSRRSSGSIRTGPRHASSTRSTRRCRPRGSARSSTGRSPPRSPDAGSPGAHVRGPLPRPSLLDRPVRQIALVVADLEVAVRAYADALGIGPWNVYTIGAPAMTGMTYRGEPADFVIRHALAFSGEVMLELVQPHRRAEHLAGVPGRPGAEPPSHRVLRGRLRGCRRGDGVARLDRGADGGRVRAVARRPVHVLRAPAATGIIAEVVKPPSERFPPEWTYPAPDADLIGWVAG